MSRPLGDRQAAMVCAACDTSAPPDRPEQAGGAARDERPAPVGVEDDRGDERRRDDGADRRAGVDDAHRGRALARREPFSDGLGRGGEAAAFAGAEQESAERERAEAGGKAVRRHRPATTPP